ncbi:MAG: MaoC/PaaZ C-terminal domain-containing protein [Candidatus Lernaella stagnicola]|nr:MaoC/PaaZ C-terminal domain-containing protein [Candidatus Lernaella stagnicola]
MQRGLFFEDFEEGMHFVSKGRTITETDVVNFAGISGDYNPLHTNEQYAKTTIFGRRVAHGVLGIALMVGLNQSLGITEDTMHAFLGLEWDFIRPVFIGDTLHLELEVESKRESKKPDRGVVNFRCKMVNQHSEVVQEGVRKMLMKRRQK